MPAAVPAKPHVNTIDGMRAIAAISIMFVHLLPGNHVMQHLFLRTPVGVTFFFVLAGFLLTNTLLGSLKKLDSKQAGLAGTLTSLQCKRAIRLLPTYLVVVIVAALLGMKNGYASLPWLLTFTINWGMIYDVLPFVHASHLWYLAAQEQVFLFWPLLIFLMPRRWLFPALLAALFSGPLLRLFLSLPFWEFPWLMRRISPFSVVDMIAAGGCLAWLMRDLGKEGYVRSRWPARLLYIGLTGTVVITLMRYYILGFWSAMIPANASAKTIASAANVMLDVFFESILIAWLIGLVWTGMKGWPERILSSKPLVWLGALSFSVYLVHHYMIEVAPILARWCHLPYPEPGFTQFLILASLSIVFASILYYAVELPSNLLRERLFPSRSPRQS